LIEVIRCPFDAFAYQAKLQSRGATMQPIAQRQERHQPMAGAALLSSRAVPARKKGRRDMITDQKTADPRSRADYERRAVILLVRG